jgi:hypothetical protein
MKEPKLTSSAFRDVGEELCEIERFTGLIETLVSAFVAAFFQLAVHGRKRKITRRVSQTFVNIVVVVELQMKTIFMVTLPLFN